MSDNEHDCPRTWQLRQLMQGPQDLDPESP